MVLTRQSVASLSIPAGKPYHIEWDKALPGFGVRINPTNKVWVVQYRVAGKSRRETIGRVNTIPLDEARKIARATLARVQLGGDPKTERSQAMARAGATVGAVAQRYLKYAQARLKPRSYEEVERHLARHWKALHNLPLDKVRRTEVATRLGEIAEAHGPFASNRARAAFSAFFTWAMGEGLAEGNPVAGTNKATEEVSRDHVLTDSELAAIWKACRDDDYGRIVRLLMLTGQRREEVASLARPELDLDTACWTIPKQRTKNGLPHEVPLCAAALDVLGSAPKRHDRALLFGEGNGGFQGWSKAKAALDKRIAQQGAPVRPWRLHDLRRTMATRLGDLGVLPHVIEAVLNHVSGHKAGVAGIYNRATYLREKREALQVWADHVLGLTATTARQHARTTTIAYGRS